MSQLLSNSSNTSSGVKSFINGLFKYDYLVIFGGFGIVFLSAILITILYDQTDSMRNNVLFNNLLAVCMGIFFIYLVFTFMGQYITILKVRIDFGLILFISLGVFIILVLGD